MRIRARDRAHIYRGAVIVGALLIDGALASLHPFFGFLAAGIQLTLFGLFSL